LEQGHFLCFGAVGCTTKRHLTAKEVQDQQLREVYILETFWETYCNISSAFGPATLNQ